MTFDRAFFDAGIDRRHTGCEKWDDPGVLGENGIPLWVADMDFPCAPAIAQAIRERAAHPCFGYNCGDPRDEAALRGYWQRRHGLEVGENETVMLPCVITGLKTCVRAFTREGEGVAVMPPVYGPFYEAVAANGRRIYRAPLEPDENGVYRIGWEKLEDALRRGVRLIMFCSPHNPVSRLWTREELTALVSLAARYDARIVCDEIHADFAYAPGAFVPILSVKGAAERTVMLCSASKTFNVAGLQQAAAVVKNADMAEKIKGLLKAAGVVSGNTFALAAARAAYTQGDGWLDGLIRYLDGNRKALADFVSARLPRARMTLVEATYLAWLDMRAYGYSCGELTDRCRRRGVAFTEGTFFGQEGEGFLRVNFGCPQKQLLMGMERLCQALKEE